MRAFKSFIAVTMSPSNKAARTALLMASISLVSSAAVLVDILNLVGCWIDVRSVDGFGHGFGNDDSG